MAAIEIDDTTWQDFLALCARLDIRAPGGYLAQWLRQIVKHEAIAQGRYVPIVDAIVTRDESEILLVANQYAPEEPLRWSFPGGSVEPGEDLSRPRSVSRMRRVGSRRQRSATWPGSHSTTRDQKTRVCIPGA